MCQRYKNLVNLKSKMSNYFNDFMEFRGSAAVATGLVGYCGPNASVRIGSIDRGNYFDYRGHSIRMPEGSMSGLETSGSKILVNRKVYFDTDKPDKGYWPKRKKRRKKRKEEINDLKNQVSQYTNLIKEITSASSQADSGDDVEEDKGKCVVCLDKDATMVFVECGHMCICELCQPGIGAKCPMCRTEGRCRRIYST